MPKFIDLTGQKFGTLTVIERGPDKVPGVPRWRCRCACGRETLSWSQTLRNGMARTCKSCASVGKSQNFRHGMRRTRVWGIWQAMKQRCQLVTCPAYAKYGAKGIKVCEKWQTFEGFYADMGDPTTDKHTLDRYPDQRGNYEPGNCRWATMKEQNNNRTNNRRIEYGGETLTLMEWAERTGIHHTTIANRTDNLGWTVDQALGFDAEPNNRLLGWELRRLKMRRA